MDERLKFFNEIKKSGIQDCPPSRIAKTTQAYHLAVLPLDDSRNFRTPFERKPRRNNVKDYKCTEYAISFFSSATNAEKFFFTKLNERIRSILGYTHMASGELTEEDGYQTNPRVDGHFDLFEFESRRATFTTRFQIISTLTENAGI